MPRSLLALLLATAFASAAPVPKAVKKAWWYPVSAGARWEYIHDGREGNVWVEEVVECEEKDGATDFAVQITVPGGGKVFERLRLKGGELLLLASQYGTYDPPLPLAKAGMQAGDEWATTTVLKRDGRDVMTYEYTLTVGKAEEITTPAGKYTATPVSQALKSERGTSTLWYADGVGLVRETNTLGGQPRQELKAFTPGKK